MVRISRSNYAPCNLDWRRRLSLETLECRQMLSVSPVVTGVEVSSTSWSPAFINSFQNLNQDGIEGYAIPTGSSAQSASLTWINLDQIKIRFSQDVQIDASDLSVSGANATTYEFANFHYDPRAHLATWTLSTPLDREKVRLDLDADGPKPVRNLSGDVLDGEWTNNSSIVSGNGTAGGDFQFTFNVLITDVNNTGGITTSDYLQIRQLEGKLLGATGYLAKRDIDGSGAIDITDWLEAIGRYFETLPSGTPAGASNDAPTTDEYEYVQINDSAVDVAISLLSHFADIEGASSGLTYSVMSNSDS
jgi:hypothetical protein